MEVGTEILIERMKTHPEEFIEGSMSKWGRVWAYGMEWLPEDDKRALKTTHKRMQLDRFNEMVLKTLAGEAEVETVTYKASERYTGGFTDPRAFANAVVKAEGMVVAHHDHIDAHKQILAGIESWKGK